MVLDVELSPKGQAIKKKLLEYLKEVYFPAMPIYQRQREELRKKHKSDWVSPPILEDLKKKARSRGLWNLFLPKEYPEGAGLTNVEYAHLAEVMLRSLVLLM